MTANAMDASSREARDVESNAALDVESNDALDVESNDASSSSSSSSSSSRRRVVAAWVLVVTALASAAAVARGNARSVARAAFGRRTMSEDERVSAVEVSDRKRFELDVVMSVYDENPGTVLGHLETCCRAETCRAWVYSSFNSGVSVRSHSLESARREVHELEDWLAVNTTFEKRGARVNNSWTGTESTAYVTHVHEHYDDLADKIAFVHGHVTSWHSDRLCDIIQRGLSKIDEVASRDDNSSSISKAPTVYVNVNRPYDLRCMSRTGVSGVFADENLRDGVYGNWKKWTGEDPPERMTWECCAQFVTTRESLRARSSAFWKNLYDLMPSSSTEKVPWEYLWPTFVDEVGSSKRGSC